MYSTLCILFFHWPQGPPLLFVTIGDSVITVYLMVEVSGCFFYLCIPTASFSSPSPIVLSYALKILRSLYLRDTPKYLV